MSSKGFLAFRADGPYNVLILDVDVGVELRAPQARVPENGRMWRRSV